MNFAPFKVLLAATAALLVSVAAPAQTVTAANTFGTGNGGFGYNSGTGYVVNGSAATIGHTYEQAFAFTAGATGSLSSLSLALSINDHAIPYGVTLNLVDGGGTPASGSVIESWMISSPGTALPEPGDPVTTPHTFTSAANPLLTTGQTYWLWLEPTNGTDATRVVWDQTDAAVTGTAWVRIDGGTWTSNSPLTSAAYQVSVTAIPEPATYALAAGVLGFGVVLARRRQAAT